LGRAIVFHSASSVALYCGYLILTKVSGDTVPNSLMNLLRVRLSREIQQSSLRVVHGDYDAEDRFVRYSGLERTRWVLFDEHERAVSLSPTLAIGLLPLTQYIAGSEPLWLKVLTAWPGFRYLPYGFSEERLNTAAREVIDGAKEPILPGLFPTRDDVLHLTAAVRHWLENRRRNVKSTRDDVYRAAGGDVKLHPTHLDRVMAISTAHQQMLKMLWVLEPAASRYAPRTKGIVPMKRDIERIAFCWLELETKRAALKATDHALNGARLAEMVTALDAVEGSIDDAIATSRLLDREILAGEEE